LHIPYDPIKDRILPALQIGEKIDEGTYGKIVKAQRALYIIPDPTHPTQIERIEDFSEIVCKITGIDEEYCEGDTAEEKEEWYAEEVQAILHEASLHALAYHVLKSHGYQHVVPQLYEVYALGTPVTSRAITKATDISSVAIGMEFVSGETLHSYLASHFVASEKPRVIAANDRLLMDVLIQLSIYLDILQTDLRFNHRDLKVNNVLRRHHSTVWHKSIEHESMIRPWITYNDLVIIDFGFSCVACDDSRKSLVQAGSWFKPTHDCLKRGRDIALFLYCLQCYYPLEDRISPDFLEVLQDACTIPYGKEFLCLLKTNLDRHGIPKDGPMEFGDGIYKLLRREEVDVAGCAPKALLQALNALRG
jgi:serine/threonine protein kinase